MKNPSDLLLKVWREACKHVHIEDSMEAIGRILIERMSLDGVLIRIIDFSRLKVETVTTAYRKEPELNTEAYTLVDSKHQYKLEEWLSSGEIILKKPNLESNRLAGILLPSWVKGDALIAPLITENHPHGLVIIYVNENRRLIPDHKKILADLLEALCTALNNHQRLEEIKILKEAAEADRDSLMTRYGRPEIGDSVIGAKNGLKNVMQRVNLVSGSDMPVLIFGETGSGKEVIARAIHQQSPRNQAPFIRVNCGAIPPELIDSELFGHERGSFTGAIETRQGWFERADGGTLFLDEIGELPLAAQVRLLRVLQDGNFERVGGIKTLHVDVRIVAATHRDLPGMVNEQSFREDLWYRLAVFPVNLPPLRERREDIPELARHFTLKATQRFGLPAKLITDEMMEMLLNYHWPGNVRELGSVIERATILSKGLTLDIDAAIGLQPAEKSDPDSALIQTAPEYKGSSFPSLDQIMNEHIHKALKISKGRVEGPFGAANLLDINPNTLRARMRKLGVDWKKYRPD